MSLTTPELAASYGKAWAAHDVDAILDLHTPESVFHVHGLTVPATGREAIAEAIAAMFGQASDLCFETRRGYLGSDHIVVEYLMTGTADGSPFACDGVDVIAVSGGLVQRKDTYLDLAAYQRQGLPGFNAK
jgi:ketosteroid isomerase-like protein